MAGGDALRAGMHKGAAMSQPETARELIQGILHADYSEVADVANDGMKLARRVELIDALHHPVDVIAAPEKLCVECMVIWPCPTRRALDGLE